MKAREQAMNVYVLTEVAGQETEVKGVFAHEALAMLAADEKTLDFWQVLDLLPGERKWTAPAAGRGNRVGWYEITEHEVQS